MGDCYLSAAGAMSKSFPPCHAVLRKDDTFCNYIAQTSVYLYLLIIEYIYMYILLYMVTDTIIEKTCSLSNDWFLTAAGLSIIS